MMFGIQVWSRKLRLDYDVSSKIKRKTGTNIERDYNYLDRG